MEAGILSLEVIVINELSRLIVSNLLANGCCMFSNVWLYEALDGVKNLIPLEKMPRWYI